MQAAVGGRSRGTAGGCAARRCAPLRHGPCTPRTHDRHDEEADGRHLERTVDAALVTHGGQPVADNYHYRGGGGGAVVGGRGGGGRGGRGTAAAVGSTAQAHPTCSRASRRQHRLPRRHGAPTHPQRAWRGRRPPRRGPWQKCWSTRQPGKHRPVTMCVRACDDGGGGGGGGAIQRPGLGVGGRAAGTRPPPLLYAHPSRDPLPPARPPLRTTRVIQGTEKALFIMGCCHSCRICAAVAVWGMGGRRGRHGRGGTRQASAPPHPAPSPAAIPLSPHPVIPRSIPYFVRVHDALEQVWDEEDGAEHQGQHRQHLPHQLGRADGGQQRAEPAGGGACEGRGMAGWGMALGRAAGWVGWSRPIPALPSPCRRRCTPEQGSDRGGPDDG